MLTSTRLSINMLGRADRVRIRGLSNTIDSEKSERTAGADWTYRRALALATRIARVSDLPHIPLPEAMLVVPTTEGVVTNGAEAPQLEASRPMQVPMRDRLGDLAVSAARAPSLSVMSLSPRGLGNGRFLETLATKTRSALSAIAAMKGPSPSTLGFQNNVSALPGPSMQPGVMAATAVDRTDGLVAQHRNDKLLPKKLVDQRLAAWTSASLLETRLPAPFTLMPKIPVSLAGAMLRHSGRPDLETKRSVRSAATLGIAAVLKSPRRDRVSDRLAGDAERRGVLPASSPGRGSPEPRSGFGDGSDSHLDLRQRAVPTIPAPTRYRMQGQEAVRRDPTSPAPQREDIDSGARSLALSQAINIMGVLTVDSRHLGRLTASSQAREASLPARGPSRVNLRAVPIFSGMKIPS